MSLYEWKPGQCDGWAFHPECDVRGTWMLCIYGLLQKTIRNTFFVALLSHLFFSFILSLSLSTNKLNHQLLTLVSSVDSIQRRLQSLHFVTLSFSSPWSQPHDPVPAPGSVFRLFDLSPSERWTLGDVALQRRWSSLWPSEFPSPRRPGDKKPSFYFEDIFKYQLLFLVLWLRLEEAALIVAVAPFLPRPGNSAESKPFYWLLSQSWLL